MEKGFRHPANTNPNGNGMTLRPCRVPCPLLCNMFFTACVMETIKSRHKTENQSSNDVGRTVATSKVGRPSPSMADQASHEVDASPDGAGKKELTKDQLKSYVHKARGKIRKLEEQNQSLLAKVEEAKQQSASANGADKGEMGCVCLPCLSTFDRCFSGTFLSDERRLWSALCLCIWSDDGSVSCSCFSTARTSYISPHVEIWLYSIIWLCARLCALRCVDSVPWACGVPPDTPLAFTMRQQYSNSTRTRLLLLWERTKKLG